MYFFDACDIIRKIAESGEKMLELFLTFAKIGLFTIGGGYAMLAIIEDTVVSQKK